jgi:hypothetical protein
VHTHQHTISTYRYHLSPTSAPPPLLPLASASPSPTFSHQHFCCNAFLKYSGFKFPDHSMPSSLLQPQQSLLPPMQHSHHQLHPVLISFTSLNHTQLFSHTYTFSACSIAALLLHTFSISQLPFINSQLILSFLFFTPRLTARLTRTEVSRCGSRGISAIASMEWHWVPMAGATPSAHCSRGTPA